MPHSIKVFLLTLPVFLVLDFTWLAVLMAGFYKTALGHLARTSGGALTPNWPAAAVVYLLAVAGLVAFVLPRIAPAAPLWQTCAWGALFGLVSYGLYDFTNYSTLNAWPFRLTLVDTLWGATVCGLTSLAMRAIDAWLVR